MCTSGQKFEPKLNGLEPKWLRTCIYIYIYVRTTKKISKDICGIARDKSPEA
jgi:hypothetical protein